MANSTEKKLYTYPRHFITDFELAALLGGTPDSRYGKVKRLVGDGVLLRIRRGLYILTKKMGIPTQPHPYELAQHIYGPSYISLESALSFHQLIPERVYTITSATSKRSKEFHTPLGLFDFQHLPKENLYLGVELIKENDYQFFMAKPWKALCDYVFCQKNKWSFENLCASLRILPEELPIIKNEEIQLLKEYYQHQRVSRFLKSGIQYLDSRKQ